MPLVVTASIEAMRFLRAVAVGDEASCYCSLERSDERRLTARIETSAQSRDRDAAEKATEESFTYIPVDKLISRRVSTPDGPDDLVECLAAGRGQQRPLGPHAGDDGRLVRDRVPT